MEWKTSMGHPKKNGKVVVLTWTSMAIPQYGSVWKCMEVYGNVGEVKFSIGEVVSATSCIEFSRLRLTGRRDLRHLPALPAKASHGLKSYRGLLENFHMVPLDLAGFMENPMENPIELDELMTGG